MCVYINIYIHTHIYTYINTYIHTFNHTYVGTYRIAYNQYKIKFINKSLDIFFLILIYRCNNIQRKNFDRE